MTTVEIADSNAALSEILGFYGLGYWYAWQVTVLGLGPVWQSENPAVRAHAARLLADGHVAGRGARRRVRDAAVARPPSETSDAAVGRRAMRAHPGQMPLSIVAAFGEHDPLGGCRGCCF